MTDEDKPGLVGQIRNKLIRSKEDWAREGRLLTGRRDFGRVNRLPPGQREVKNWPVLDLGVQPNVSTDRWAFSVDGMVENTLLWRWPDFLKQPQVRRRSDIHCVTAWSRFGNTWDGVSAAQLLDLVKPKPEA